MTERLRFFEQAVREIDHERGWYRRKSHVAEAGFLRELDHALDVVAAVVYVEVERSWKGAKRGSTISAYSSLSELDCGRAYQVGERILFTTRVETSRVTNCSVLAGGMCSWTDPVEEAQDAIVRLDRWAWWWRLPFSRLLHGRGEQAPKRCVGTRAANSAHAPAVVPQKAASQLATIPRAVPRR